MRLNKAIVLVAVVIVLAWGLGASKEGLKVGVVDLEHAVSSTTGGKAAREEFERKAREAEASLQPMIERFQAMAKEFEAKKFVLSEDALMQKQLDLAELRNQIQNKQKEMQGQLEVDRERLMGPLQRKLGAVIDELGREEGFSMIFMRNTPGLAYTREALDITDLVIEKFNEKG
ncbi:MAG: OmpH family outer membrane protein [Deltaproteobacteria bacterium]|nr:OmpH family outer membrane protein [Deltaproteobacteria bacterium]